MRGRARRLNTPARSHTRSSTAGHTRPPPPPHQDVQAFGVLEAARELHLRVPDDIAVIGFDDIEPATTIGLTTVRQPFRQSGMRGAELLIAAIDGDEQAPIAEFEPLDVIQRLTT